MDSCNYLNCKKRKKYGLFCYKHRRNHLVLNNEIIKKRFTGISKDYLKNDILNTLMIIYKDIFNNKEKLKLYSNILFKQNKNDIIIEKINKIYTDKTIIKPNELLIINTEYLNGWLFKSNNRIKYKNLNIEKSIYILKKEELFSILKVGFNIEENIKEENIKEENSKEENSDKIYINKIIKIQRAYKHYLYYNKGPGLKNINESKNLEDFYTLDSIEDIPLIYFISYKDNNENIWCFDIRSIKKLIDISKNNKDIYNPYNRENIPFKKIKKIKKIIKVLKKQNIILDYEENINYSREEILKRNIVDIFSEIGRMGYFVDINWFYELDLIQLKDLYKSLEDIWNYRAQLSIEVKKQIAPPNGILYSVRINDINRINNKIEIMEIIKNELKQIYNNYNNDNKLLGYMYFIIGLSQVNRNCYNSHVNWISYSI